jgi:hypothetical protein
MEASKCEVEKKMPSFVQNCGTGIKIYHGPGNQVGAAAAVVLQTRVIG